MTHSIDVNILRQSVKYSIEIGEGCLFTLADSLKAKFDFKENLPKIILITHHNLNNLYGIKLAKQLTEAGFQVHSEIINTGESIKTWASAERILNKMIDLKMGRQGLVLALGGGVIGDLAGFCASVYNRGVKLVHVPTSLLAMVDSSIGGKVAVNLGVSGKNLIGAFYQPSLVISDTQTLKTLPDSEWKNGLSEVLKYALIKEDGGHFYKSLLENKVGIVNRSNYKAINTMISECIKTKASMVAKDEQETGESRILLNLGHTFGHSLEAASRYRMAHGEAVAIGVCLAAKLGLKLGKITPGIYDNIINLVKVFGLPHQIDKKFGFTPGELIRHFEYDKKNEGKVVRFIIPSGTIGHCEVARSVDENLLKEIFSEAIV
jgi:3-dehydroquinate synthase